MTSAGPRDPRRIGLAGAAQHACPCTGRAACPWAGEIRRRVARGPSAVRQRVGEIRQRVGALASGAQSPRALGEALGQVGPVRDRLADSSVRAAATAFSPSRSVSAAACLRGAQVGDLLQLPAQRLRLRLQRRASRRTSSCRTARSRAGPSDAAAAAARAPVPIDGQHAQQLARSGRAWRPAPPAAPPRGSLTRRSPSRSADSPSS